MRTCTWHKKSNRLPNHQGDNICRQVKVSIKKNNAITWY